MPTPSSLEVLKSKIAEAQASRLPLTALRNIEFMIVGDNGFNYFIIGRNASGLQICDNREDSDCLIFNAADNSDPEALLAKIEAEAQAAWPTPEGEELGEDEKLQIEII